MGNIHGNCINVRSCSSGTARPTRASRTRLSDGQRRLVHARVQKTGPDGCLYILDWYDRYHCYQDASRDPHGIDRLKGRLYRVRYKDTPGRQSSTWRKKPTNSSSSGWPARTSSSATLPSDYCGSRKTHADRGSLNDWLGPFDGHKVGLHALVGASSVRGPLADGLSHSLSWLTRMPALPRLGRPRCGREHANAAPMCRNRLRSLAADARPTCSCRWRSPPAKLVGTLTHSVAARCCRAVAGDDSVDSAHRLAQSAPAARTPGRTSSSQLAEPGRAKSRLCGRDHAARDRTACWRAGVTANRLVSAAEIVAQSDSDGRSCNRQPMLARRWPRRIQTRRDCRPAGWTRTGAALEPLLSGLTGTEDGPRPLPTRCRCWPPPGSDGGLAAASTLPSMPGQPAPTAAAGSACERWWLRARRPCWKHGPACLRPERRVRRNFVAECSNRSDGWSTRPWLAVLDRSLSPTWTRISKPQAIELLTQRTAWSKALLAAIAAGRIAGRRAQREPDPPAASRAKTPTWSAGGRVL